MKPGHLKGCYCSCPLAALTVHHVHSGGYRTTVLRQAARDMKNPVRSISGEGMQWLSLLASSLHARRRPPAAIFGNMTLIQGQAHGRAASMRCLLWQLDKLCRCHTSRSSEPPARRCGSTHLVLIHMAGLRISGLSCVRAAALHAFI